MKFIHAADIHLDSPLRGLERYEGAPVDAIRQATRRALENLVRVAVEESVDFVLLAGDIYDGDWEDHNTGLFFAHQMARLRAAKIRVFLIAGNHDAQSKMTRSVLLPSNVVTFPAREPATELIEELRVAIHGQSFFSPVVKEDLSSRYPMAVPGYFNIGMLHTCATGREGHEPYAPCTIEGLRAKGYDYWALGHIHLREVLCEDPLIVFPGNIQGRHIRETGPKGCLLVEVDTGGRARWETRWLDVLRWVRCPVDGSDCESPYELLDRFAMALESQVREAEGRSLAVRVDVRGASAAHGELMARPEHWRQQFRAKGTDVGVGLVWVEKVSLGTKPLARARDSTGGDGPIEELRELIAEYGSSEVELQAIGKDLAEFHKKLPPDLREGEWALDFASPGAIRAILADVEALLVERLTGRGVDE